MDHMSLMNFHPSAAGLDPQYRNVMHKLIGPCSNEVIGEVSRTDFPKDFLFGSAAAAYQFEGAHCEDGKGPSVWDSWTQLHPERIKDGTNGNVAINQYHLYKDDIQMMKRTGLQAYRFSISWPRVLPGGKRDAGVNRKGIQYYNNLIDELIANGIEPCVTLFHWDLPLALELAYRGFLSRDIIQDFVDYAELCFWEFGDRVKNWITFNEGWTYCNFGYVAGTFPPGRGTTKETHSRKHDHVTHKGGGVLDAKLWKGDHTNMEVPRLAVPKRSLRSSAGDSEGDGMIRPTILTKTSAVLSYIADAQENQAGGAPRFCCQGDAGKEPYIAAHNMILAHATVVDMYRKHFQESQGGKIGITNVSKFFEPMNDTVDDKNAVIRSLDWVFGWFTAPVTTGDYPPNMRETCGKRLPTFTEDEFKLVKGSYDFIGINYYTTQYATLQHKEPGQPDTYVTDRGVENISQKHGNDIGESSGAKWLYSVPRGIYNLLVYAKETYKINLFYITENGWCDNLLDPRVTTSDAKKDPARIKYYKEHLWYLKKAISEAGVNVKRYFLWSLADNFEWADGYTYRFGMFHIDFVNGQLTRTPKDSAIWLRNFLTKKSIGGLLKRDATAESENESELRKRFKSEYAY